MVGEITAIIELSTVLLLHLVLIGYGLLLRYLDRTSS